VFESATNQLAAIVGFDGTESEMVGAWYNSQSDEERELITETMGVGVMDQIAHGERKALEVFATYQLARTMAGGGRLNVNTIEAAKKIVSGSGDTQSLSKLNSGIKTWKSKHERKVIQLSESHNALLTMSPEGNIKRVTERVQGYPVYNSGQYIKQMNRLHQKVDSNIVELLDDMHANADVFQKDEFGITQVPTLLRVTDADGNEGFDIQMQSLNLD
jgi:hypothetical protein